MNDLDYQIKQRSKFFYLARCSICVFICLFIYLFTFFIFSFSANAQDNNASDKDQQQKLVAAAIERTQHDITYDGSYFSIPYPNGDVPVNIGVFTDVVIRSYRALGIDLQQLVHEDMAKHFDQYPSKRIWGLTRPDKNIDHRRVLNLQTFFQRKESMIAISRDPKIIKREI